MSSFAAVTDVEECKEDEEKDDCCYGDAGDGACAERGVVRGLRTFPTALARTADVVQGEVRQGVDGEECLRDGEGATLIVDDQV